MGVLEDEAREGAQAWIDRHRVAVQLVACAIALAFGFVGGCIWGRP